MRLDVRDLVLKRGERTVIGGLTFSAGAGEILVLRGPNGAGKTTLIRAIAGFMTPAHGTIGLENGDSEREIREHCHYVGHLNGLKSALTVRENLAFWADYLAVAPLAGREGAIEAALAAFDLAALASVPTAYMSAGQKRRAALARLLAVPRPVWLLDEPTVSLDAASTTLLARAVEGHAAAGGIVIAATHVPLGLARERVLRLGETRDAA